MFSRSRSSAALISRIARAAFPKCLDVAPHFPVVTLPSVRSPTPSVLQPVRCYDRKRYEKEKKLRRAIENQEDISLSDAMAVLKSYAMGQDKLVTAHVVCRKPEEGAKPVRGDVALPVPVSTAGSSAKILVFAKGPLADEARALGAAFVGDEELIAQVAAGQIEFDHCLSTKELFPQVVKIARILGPKGLMPSPSKGTVSDDIKQMMAALRATSKFEIDADGYISLELARTAWPNADIQKNLRAFVKAVIDAKPSKFNAITFVEGVSLSGPLLPGFKLPLRPFRDLMAKS
ncbi:ribosomal protein L1-like protein [Zopfochytrium polystomum]|nr:ribosomal protein L1-like protein [Zopfochytrium polystomum]